MEGEMTIKLGYKNITHFISQKVRKVETVRVKETGSRRQTEDCYIDPNLLLLLS